MKIFKKALSFKGKRCDVCHVDVDSIANLPDALLLKAHAVCIYDKKMVLVNHSEWNIWGIPGGTREKGESIKETLKREILEETNCEIIDSRPISYQKVILPDNKYYYQVQYVCHVIPRGEFVSDSAGNINKIMWIDPLDFYGYIEEKEFKIVVIERAIFILNKIDEDNKN